jgi:putative transferase (TIGR04331 family)
MLSKLKKHQGGNDDIIFVGTASPSYMHHLHSSLMSEQLLDYFLNKDRFLKTLNPLIIEKIKYRPYFEDYGMGEMEFLNGRLSESQFLTKGLLTDALRKTRLAVVDNLTTTHLQSLAMNVPTIIFHDPGHFAINADARPFFNKLSNAGILFSNAEDAAKKVNEVWPDVRKWWESRAVQEARSEFCWQFARTSKNWRKDWTSFLKDVRALRD